MLPRVTHEHARTLLPRYAAGALDLATAAELRRHMTGGCGECLHELFAQQSSRRAEPRPHPPIAADDGRDRTAAARRVVDAARTRGALPAAPSRRVARPRPAAVAAAVVVAVSVAIAWTIGRYATDGPSTRLATRVAALEIDRAELARRVAKLTRDLFTTRNTTPFMAAPNPADGVDAVARRGDDARRATTAPPVDDGPLTSIRYSQDDTLSMRLRSAPLPSVLEEIGRQSGVTIRARVLDTRTVTVAFEDVPFKQALRRLLGVQNFLLTYDGPRPRLLEVLETPTVPPLVGTASDHTLGSDAPSNTAPPQSVAAVLDRGPPVALSDTLRAALGTSAMPLRQLLDTGINHVDQGIRASAMREAVAALQADPNLRAAMFGTRPGMKGGIFGTLVEGMDTERAEEMLFYVAIGARDSQVRNDAATLIQQVAMAGTRRDG